MNSLALDMATKTGWATNINRTSGVQAFAVKRGESPGMRLLPCRAWLNEMLSLLGGIEVLVYESKPITVAVPLLLVVSGWYRASKSKR